MIIRPLHSMPYAQATVIECHGKKTLISYSTEVATVDEDGWLRITGLYSATTRRHISAFMREMNDEYSNARYCYDYGKKYNVNDGYFEDLD